MLAALGKEAVIPLCDLGCGMRSAAPLLCSGSLSSRTGHPGALGVPGNAKRVLNHGTAQQLCGSVFSRGRARSVRRAVSLAQTWARLTGQMEAFPTAPLKWGSIPTQPALAESTQSF